MTRIIPVRPTPPAADALAASGQGKRRAPSRRTFGIHPGYRRMFGHNTPSRRMLTVYRGGSRRTFS